MVRIGLKCSVDQLMTTGLFHAGMLTQFDCLELSRFIFITHVSPFSSDPHRGNLLRTPTGELAWIDFGMMADIDESDRYGLFGLVIGLQNKDLPLITENLLKVSVKTQSIPRYDSVVRTSTFVASSFLPSLDSWKIQRNFIC